MESTRVIVRRGSLLIAALTLAACSSTDDADTNAVDGSDKVGVEVRTQQPRYSAGQQPQVDMVLRNNGSQPCSLPSTPVGSVEILTVRRDGAAVVGRAERLDLYGGMADIVADGMRSVEPGESITVPLGVGPDDDGSPVVISTNETNGNSARTTTWPVGEPGDYQIIASLTQVAGVDRPDLPAACAPPQSTATVEFEVAP